MDADLLRSADARVRLDLVAPTPARIADATLRAPPSGLDAGLAAAALAYLLRFEIERRDAGTPRGAWLAESAPERLATLAPELVDEAAARVGAAKQDVARCVSGRDPVARATLAEHALRLGRLDAAVRVGYVDERVRDPERPEDVADVLAMLDAVPWDALGEGASDLGEDLVARGTLLAVKAAKAARVDADDVRALVLRFLLMRARRPEAAERVQRIGVLLARHGHLWTAPTSGILGHAALPAVEEWLAARLRLETARPQTGAPRWVKQRFPPKAPLTHPEGKADRKKSRAPSQAPPEPKAPRAPRKPAQDAPPERTRTARPDWRKGSKWRRERGL